MNDETALWDPWFRSHEGVVFVKNLCADHHVHIQINTRKSNLVVFGGSTASRLTISEALAAQIQGLNCNSRRIVLDKDLLSKALRGGMQKIRKKFGKAATFNLSILPRSIIINGSREDVLLARSLLNESSGETADETKEDDCSVCW